jgi:hypothetical protein
MFLTLKNVYKTKISLKLLVSLKTHFPLVDLGKFQNIKKIMTFHTIGIVILKTIASTVICY